MTSKNIVMDEKDKLTVVFDSPEALLKNNVTYTEFSKDHMIYQHILNDEGDREGIDDEFVEVEEEDGEIVVIKKSSQLICELQALLKQKEVSMTTFKYSPN